MSPFARFGAAPVAIGMLVAASLFMGGAMATAKVAVADLPPVTVAAARFTIAALVLVAIRLALPTLAGPGRRPRIADVPLFLGLGLTAAAGYNLLLLNGVRLAPASDAAMIAPAVGPVVSVLIAAVLFGERPRGMMIAGLAVSIAGVALVVGPAGAVDGDRLVGDLLFVGCGTLWGIYLVVSRAAARRFGALDITLYGTLVAAIVLLPLAILEGGIGRLAGASVPSLLAVAHLAALATVAAFVLLNAGLRRLGVSRSAGFTMLIPVFGVLQAMLLLGEPLVATALPGIGAVLAGIWLTQGGGLPRVGWRRGRAVAPANAAAPAAG